MVDPHDQAGVADALLKLLADKLFWMECRRNGLKNIHLFSWPEHCKTYLSRIALCRMRYPKWQNDDDSAAEPDSNEDSLRDIGDLEVSLTSLDDIDISEGSGSTQTQTANSVPNKLSSYPRLHTGNLSFRTPNVRRRKRLVTIAVDCYGSTQSQGADLVSVIKNIFEATHLSPAYRNAGYVLSSSLKLSELLTILESGNISAYEFDVLICSSGSELFYPGYPGSEDGGNSDPQLCVDEDYDTHIAYRWDRVNVRKTMSRWLTKYEQLSRALVEDDCPSNNYCLAYNVKDVDMVCVCV